MVYAYNSRRTSLGAGARFGSLVAWLGRISSQEAQLIIIIIIIFFWPSVSMIPREEKI